MDYETLVHEWFEEVWNQGRVDAIDRLFAADGIAHGLADGEGNALRGPEGYKPFFHQFKGAFPNLRVDVEDTVCEGDKIAARCVVRGTHTGEGLGMAATHRDVSFTGMTILRIKDGQIVEAWNNFDLPGLFAQLTRAE
jgi:steroid delta-isomerase-like uncharacterized protein